MTIKKWLQGELFAVLRRQPLPYRDPAKIRNMIRDIPAPHFILFTSVFIVPVKFQQLILEPCEWVLKRRSFFYFWWVAWRSTWRSEVALPKDSQLHGFNCCLVPICTSLLKPSLSVEILTHCCWLHCRHPANSINPTATNRRQLLWT